MRINDITPESRNIVKHILETEVKNAPAPIRVLVGKALVSFQRGEFSYDGATFVREATPFRFEAAAFIHDWRNGTGYVGRQIDREMFRIMRELDYPTRLIVGRWIWCWFTGLNVWRHRIKGTLKKELPKDLYN